MQFPDNIRYTNEHEWIRLEGNEAYIGITDYAQSELGDIVFVEVETVGESLKQGATFGTIEAVKTVSDMFMPVDGTVLELNSGIEGAPDAINKDPYGKGWIIKIKPNNAADIDKLLTADAYKQLINAK